MPVAGPFLMSITPEEFLVYPTGDMKSELVRGEVRMMPPGGTPHGRVGANLLLLLSRHLPGDAALGVFGDGIGYELLKLPRTVRVPDASYIRADRLPPEGLTEGLFKLVPDLVIEVLSPSERASDLQEKLDDYQACEIPLIWVADPIRRTVTVHAHGKPARTLVEGERLDGGVVLPGFACAIADIFKGVSRELR